MGLACQSFPTADAAQAALKTNSVARYLGGGTLVVRSANEGDVDFSTYIRSTDPALTAISVAGSRATIGAGVTMARILREPALSFLAPAARAVGGPAIRNMATIGGNLFAPTPYGDFAVALLALDATLDISGSEIAAGDFFDKRDNSHARAVVRSVSLTVPKEGTFRFSKASRVKPKGASIVTIAAVIAEDAGKITSATVAYGCMANRPIRGTAAEAALIGKTRTSDGIQDALAVATEGTSPVTDAIASAWYRGEVLPVHLGRLLLAD